MYYIDTETFIPNFVTSFYYYWDLAIQTDSQEIVESTWLVSNNYIVCFRRGASITRIDLLPPNF